MITPPPPTTDTRSSWRPWELQSRSALLTYLGYVLAPPAGPAAAGNSDKQQQRRRRRRRFMSKEVWNYSQIVNRRREKVSECRRRRLKRENSFRSPLGGRRKMVRPLKRWVKIGIIFCSNFWASSSAALPSTFWIDAELAANLQYDLLLVAVRDEDAHARFLAVSFLPPAIATLIHGGYPFPLSSEKWLVTQGELG